MRWLVGLAMVLAVAGCSDSGKPKSESSYAPLDASDGNPTGGQAGPVPPAGKEFVGMGQVVVAVPEDLQHSVAGCGIPRENVARGSACVLLKEELEGASRNIGLTVSLAPFDLTRDHNYRTRPFKSDSGLEGLIGAACPTNALCLGAGRRVVLPSANLVVVATAGKRERALVDGIVESVMLVPNGYTTVPAVPLGFDTEAAARLLSDAGLKVDAPTPSPAYHFWDTTPAAGAVTEEGSTITMHVGDG